MTIFRTFYKYLYKFHIPLLLSHFPLFKENGRFISKAFFTCSIACFSESKGSFLYLYISLIYIWSLIILVCFHIYFDQVILVYTRKVDRKYTCLISMHLHGIFLCIVSNIKRFKHKFTTNNWIFWNRGCKNYIFIKTSHRSNLESLDGIMN